MKAKYSLFFQICCIVALFANLCRSAEPPRDFLENNFGLIQDENVLDIGVPFTNVLTTFTKTASKIWVSDENDQWILKISKKDLATDSIDEAAWVFQRRKADPKPLIVLVRITENKEDLPSQLVAEMANRIAASFIDVNQSNSAAQPELKPIEPFGGLKWADGIVQIVKKINQMEGIDKLSVTSEYQPLKTTSLKGLTKDSEIIFTLVGLVSFDSYHEGSYKDKDGTEHQLAVGIESLTAEPIYLKGSPFRMTLDFVSSPGFAIASPEAIFAAVVEKPDLKTGALGKQIQESCSFALTKLTLSSTSPVQNEKIQELTKSLRDKYKDYKIVSDYPDSVLVLKDNAGCTLRADWESVTDGNGLTISITYSRNMDQLNQLYETHLSDLEKKESSQKPDNSNGF